MNPRKDPAMKRRLALLAALCGCAIIQPLLRGEEGGSGHYLPGAMASFVDGVPPKETFIARYNMVYYSGDIAANEPLPIAGVNTLGADATSWAHGLSLLWRPALELGERWSYAMSATIPYVWMDVTANVTAGGTSVRRTSSLDGLGDVVLMPLMLNYNVSSNLNLNFRTGLYAPTGDYEVGRLANTSKNFWTFEPTLGLMYFGVNNGIEASMFLGADFNTENPDTDYQSGTQLHVDGTLAQHFPLFKGLAGVGVNGFWYEQVTGDSGAGATFGDFEARTAGLGPVLSYAFKLGKVDMIAEAKWLRELETMKRLEGDTVWFKLVAKF
jgi:hypothetical protein